MADLATLTQAIKAEARRLGFDLVGVTGPEPPPHLDVYARWLEAGRHGEMAYLATERARARRADPRAILPECRSILVLGVRYPAAPPLGAGESRPDAPPQGRVAAYAWGDDYHEVLPGWLRKLVAFIESQAGGPLPHRWYTDTGPLLERELAQRAGLGWIGKNTCLINPDSGSYLLLAEILLGIELSPDPPFTADRCGTCTRCLQACPTQCILPDRTLDAARCLSYLTIELKGAIPLELRPALGDWVFGCDICQQVCPWNLRFAPAAGEAAFAPRPALPRPELAAELELSQEAFSRKFKRNPVKRTRRRGYLRNVAVALGNRRASRSVPALVRSFRQEPEPLVRGHLAWALGRTGGPQAYAALQAAREVEQDPGVLAEIEAALQELAGG